MLLSSLPAVYSRWIFASAPLPALFSRWLFAIVPLPADTQQRRPGQQTFCHNASAGQLLRCNTSVSTSAVAPWPVSSSAAAPVPAASPQRSGQQQTSSGGEKYSGLASNLAHLGRMRLSSGRDAGIRCCMRQPPGWGAAAGWQMMLPAQSGSRKILMR